MKRRRERFMEYTLKGLGFFTIAITAIIIIILFVEGIGLFKEVSVKEFFTGENWSPLMEPKSFGVLPLVNGTLMIAIGSSLVAVPIGIGAAIYLSEYASKKARKILKPILEILAGIPSIVYGYFALNIITPFLKNFISDIQVFNVLSASIAVGIMVIPLISSLSEDAMSAVPELVKSGAYAMGATKFEVVRKIVIPASISGIISSIILAISRAIGETMIVAIAAGAKPQMTLNPLDSVQTMTGYMVSVAMGDVAVGSIEYKTIFIVGALLFLVTFVLNIIARSVVKRGKIYY
ncbi:phosphate ABC transporter permease subunit PstC [Clostridium massiliamazoniense]|uniref:phosphate ABC transporter permease subunit PstC n=1 Tax=Clostridium massiliamazoniense TaxID=1347366 RepID=UPI0006D797BC|nr:phosphate ABC transporter permease subunit PstC [Clostridium massiliamazoniense]